MKPDERRLRLAVYVDRSTGGGIAVDELAGAAGVDPRRALSLVEKWCDRGWWEVGVSVRFGWLTEEGLREFRREARA